MFRPIRAKCTVTMYMIQGSHVTKNDHVFHANTAHRVRDVVCDFLNVRSHEDRRFVDSVFTSKIFRWFEFVGQFPQIRGIMITGAHHLPFSIKQMEPVPIEAKNCPTIRMTFCNPVQEEILTLTAKELVEREAYDPIPAAFACSSFLRYTELNHKRFSHRVLEKAAKYY